MPLVLEQILTENELLAIASGVELFTNLSSFGENVLDSTRDGYTYQICFTGMSILRRVWMP